MRTVNQLAVPKEADLVEFPDSTVINQEPGIDGTPVIREIYGDVLTNIYAILRDAGVTANGTEDNETNGYQLLQALKQFSNDTNDTERILSVTGSVLNVNTLDFSVLPDKFVFWAVASGNALAEEMYTIQGSDLNPQGVLNNTVFDDGDELLVILDVSTSVKIFPFKRNDLRTLSLTLGLPLIHDDFTSLKYDRSGVLFQDGFSADDLQSLIRADSGDAAAVVRQMFSVRVSNVAWIMCFVFFPGVITYGFYVFDSNNLSTPISMVINGGAFPSGVDNNPAVLYEPIGFFQVTNNLGNNANDNDIVRLAFNVPLQQMFVNSSFTIDAGFVKDPDNSVFRESDDSIIVLDGSVIRAFPSPGAANNVLLDLQGAGGNIFKFNNEIYYAPPNAQVAQQLISL